MMAHVIPVISGGTCPNREFLQQANGAHFIAGSHLAGASLPVVSRFLRTRSFGLGRKNTVAVMEQAYLDDRET